MIQKKFKDALLQARLCKRKCHMPYTSHGERQTMQVLHNKSQKFLAAIKKVSSEFLMHSKNRLISAIKKSARPRKVIPAKESELVSLSEENRKRCGPEMNSCNADRTRPTFSDRKCNNLKVSLEARISWQGLFQKTTSLPCKQNC